MNTIKKEITNFQMINIIPVLNKFADATGKLGYVITRAKTKMIAEVKPFEEERDKLFRKYGTENEDGTYSVDPGSEHFQDFVKELTSILDDKTEIEIRQLTQEEYDALEEFPKEATAKDYELIEDMFVEPIMSAPENEEEENKENEEKPEKVEGEVVENTGA